MSVCTIAEYIIKYNSHQANTKLTEYGEVFTPLWLPNEMLDKLPKEVWSDPRLKWFEPACGLAPFLYVAFERLMEGLKDCFPDAADRSRHIVEKMLFFNEIQSKNIAAVKELFGAKEYALNLFEGDFLTVIPRNFRADIIVGNPPYNQRNTKNTGNTEWDKFVKHIFERRMLHDKGYLVMVHPPGWRKPESERSKYKGMFQRMAHEHQMHYLSIHDAKEGKQTFGCSTRYDWYVLQNTPSHERTLVSLSGSAPLALDLPRYEWLAHDMSIVEPLLARANEDRCQLLYSRTLYAKDSAHVSSQRSDEFKYPVVHSSGAVCYSKLNSKGFYGIPKVIFSDGGFSSMKPMLDIKGEYAMTEHAMAIVVESNEDGEALIRALQSPTFRRVLEACTWGNHQIDWRLFMSFKKRFWRELGTQTLTSNITRTTTVVKASVASVEIDMVKLQQSSGRNGYTVEQLRAFCTTHGLSKQGRSKAEIADRLLRTLRKDDAPVEDKPDNTVDKSLVANSSNRGGYTKVQLQQMCKDNHINYKSRDTKPMLVHLLLQALP